MKRDHRWEVSSCINMEEKLTMNREEGLMHLGFSRTKHSKLSTKELVKKSDSQPMS